MGCRPVAWRQTITSGSVHVLRSKPSASPQPSHAHAHRQAACSPALSAHASQGHPGGAVERLCGSVTLRVWVGHHASISVEPTKAARERSSPHPPSRASTASPTRSKAALYRAWCATTSVPAVALCGSERTLSACLSRRGRWPMHTAPRKATYGPLGASSFRVTALGPGRVPAAASVLGLWPVHPRTENARRVVARSIAAPWRLWHVGAHLRHSPWRRASAQATKRLCARA